MLHGHLNGDHANKMRHQFLLPGLHDHILLVEVINEAIEDGEIVKIVRAGLDMPVDEG